jgi:Carboxypeptidase regulatory-like domain
MRTSTLRCIAMAAGILALSVAASAQGSKLTGTVTDTNSKPVAGATIRALLPGPGDNADVVTNAKGEYEVPVSVGDWVISVAMKGFAPEHKQLAVSDRLIKGQSLKMDFTLKSADAAAVAFTPRRTPDGQIDISGTWNDNHATGDSINYDLETGHRSAEHYAGRGEKPMPNPEHAIVDPLDGKVPYQSWALAKRNENQARYQNPPGLDYVAGRSKCWLPGSPGFPSSGNPTVLQIPGYVIMMIEFSHSYRIIRLDDSRHVGSDIVLMSGDSRGRWEGNTLVVDVTNMKEQWLDLLGNFRTPAAHVVERWTLTSPTTMTYEATVDDPQAYTKPMKVVFHFNRNNNPNYEIYEDTCHEGNAGVYERVGRHAQ